MDKTILQLQNEVDEWANNFKKPYFDPLSMMACLTEEVGEVARAMNQLYGEKKKKDTENMSNLSEELADVIFNVICIANSSKIDLSDALDKKFIKVNIRDINRWEHK